MAPDLSSSGIEGFARGIQVRNPSLVKEAINAGVQPDTPVNDRHPLWILLATRYDELPSALQTGMTRDEFAKRTSEIVNDLLDSGVKVAEEGKYQTQTKAYLADHFLLSDDVNDVATIVIHAIQETLADNRPVYKPDLTRTIAGMFSSGAIAENADYRMVIHELAEMSAHLHAAVRDRLLHPQSALEKEVAARGPAIEYWTQPLPPTDMGRIMLDLGFSDSHEGAPKDLSETFTARAGHVPDFVMELEKKAPRQVLDEMASALVGLDSLKRDAKRLVFRQNYDTARATEDMAPSETPALSTAYMGYEGIGKSTFAHKQAELLVALDLAGPHLVEITHDQLGKMAGSYNQDSMTPIFREADIVHIELCGGPRDRDGRNLDDYLMSALQASLDGRKNPPVIFLSGWREDIEATLDNAPGIKALIAKFVTVEEPSIAQLGTALEKRLAGANPDKPSLVIDQDAKDLVLREFVEARKRLGEKGFRNMREVNTVAEKLPDALAERLFGSEENEQALLAATNREALLRTVTLADVKALNLRSMLGGPALMKSRGIGFHASL